MSVLHLAPTLNPFQFAFMRTAFLAGTVVALVAGLTGYFVIVRRQIFASDTLSHVAFAEQWQPPSLV